MPDLYTRDQFTFYRSYYEALLSLPQEYWLDILLAVMTYALDGIEPELDGVPKASFILIRPTLETGRMKSEARKKQSREKVPEPSPQKKKPGRKKKTEIEIEEEKESAGTAQAGILALPKQPTALDEAMEDFARARKALKKPLTDKARELTIQNLQKLAPGDEAMQIAILNQSIQRGWQGVFPLESEKTRKKESGNIFFDIAEERGLL